MSARDEIFANIRRSLGVKGSETIRKQIVQDRLERSPKGVIPARGQVSGEERIALFKTMAEASLATVTEVSSTADVPQSIALFLRDHNLPATLRMGDDPRLKSMPWGDTTLEIAHGPSEGSDLNAVSHAFGGVAETGTLAMISGHENPSTLNFLPDNHIIVVSAKDIASDYESVWGRVRFAFGKGSMPRTVNWITGPSRSGDIEQTLLLGAHGPRRLHVVVVRE
ncbi:LutC/YkgG family protein [Microvirga guangxiensis]|uniref:L-lactate dehydrogenase complex protein LldG n=1 Tax=Microvirga guangxiensis TaxID=549386 RepID=A0A1G5KUU8_9HYPH|nr:lactate utilization protein [Microvirga guangxiensis]SCZ04385.1 L-lactate dehydrogenase complex protein LldG [Microvirga guangxiensis]